MTSNFDDKSHSPSPIDLALIPPTEKAELHSSAVSITSASTALTTSSPSTFIPASSLHISTRGIPILRLPLPPSSLTTTIHRPDGSLAYTSTRRSGSCVLADATSTPLITTTYFFGPGRDPVLTLLAPGRDPAEPATSTITTTSKWTSRAQTFATGDGPTWEWAYVRERVPAPDDGTNDAARRKKGGKVVILALYRTDDGARGLGGTRVGQLLRTDETRAAGSSRTSAGNGGELQLAAGGVEGDLDEAGVVASCLVMLKKEVDRRRTVQMMVIAGGGGS
ncbi:uncharacterized protein BDZ99DRAFT_536653 [Mytilinidion resinicola]|uniref:Uncharacterized protein n=1 Tax=Mytilinidion resinicola TaxID=574789 RepID=A0A6A6YFI0_9PEZI|nr:uncharacterized protein BDZ99DRAFT_536653 [Mytilinidion resinicola]KAF2807293.1 hypothetical protein BDZ99DRAFT_536653 [Mytilinidion resinicola]